MVTVEMSREWLTPKSCFHVWSTDWPADECMYQIIHQCHQSFILCDPVQSPTVTCEYHTSMSSVIHLVWSSPVTRCDVWVSYINVISHSPCVVQSSHSLWHVSIIHQCHQSFTLCDPVQSPTVTQLLICLSLAFTIMTAWLLPSNRCLSSSDC